jgi:hypothetical protein
MVPVIAVAALTVMPVLRGAGLTVLFGIDAMTWVIGVTTLAAVLALALRPARIVRREMLPHGAVGLWAAWTGFTLIWTPGINYGSGKLVDTIIWMWLYVMGVWIGRHSESGSVRALVLVVAAISGIWASWLLLGVLGLQVSAYGTYLQNARILGAGVTFALVGVLVYPRDLGRATFRNVLFLSGAVSGLVLLILGGRGPLIAAAGTIAVVGVGLFWGRGRVRVGITYAIFTLVIVITGSGLRRGEPSLLRSLDRMPLLWTEPDGGASVAARSALQKSGQGLIAEGGLFGVGLGGFGPSLGWGDTRAYPHNLTIELMVETGIIGAGLLWLIVMSALCWTAAQGVQHRASATVAFAGLLYWWVNAHVSGDVGDNRMIGAMLGLAVGIWTNQSHQGRDPRREPTYVKRE